MSLGASFRAVDKCRVYFSRRQHMKKFTAAVFATALTVLALGTGSTANAARDADNIYVGPVLGLNNVSNDGGTNLAYGLTGGYKFMPQVGVGLFFTYNNLKEVAGITPKLTIFAVEGNYYFANDLEGLSAGLKLGNGSVSASGTSSSGFLIGPHVAYDYPVADDWTVGGQAAVLSISTTPNSLTAFEILAQAKYWF
jgi:hypothetical protein